MQVRIFFYFSSSSLRTIFAPECRHRRKWASHLESGKSSRFFERLSAPEPRCEGYKGDSMRLAMFRVITAPSRRCWILIVQWRTLLLRKQ